MVCQSKVALLASLCCIFPGAHSALSGEGTVALDSSAVSPEDKANPFDFLVENSVALENMGVEECRNEMSKMKISTDTELDALVKDFNEKITISLGETAKFLKGTAIPPEEKAAIKEKIDIASSLVVSLPVDPRKLAEAAIELKAETLLDLLQVKYIWDNPRQHHWFKALLLKHFKAENKGDLRDDYEKFFPTDWENNFLPLCEFDNDVWAVKVWEKIKDKASKDDFEELNEDVLRTCAKYDAVKVFEALKFTPIQLRQHLELMRNSKSTKLLKLYQDAEEKQKYSYLDTFTLPESVEELDIMLGNPTGDFPRMNWFIEKCCKEGRLDLLKHLRELDPTLVPNEHELLLAVKERRIDVVDWAHKEKFYLPNGWSRSVFELAASGHDRILESVLNENCSSQDQSHIASFTIDMGLLGVIKQIHQKWPTAFNNPTCVELAATRKYLSVLKWLNETFDLLPEFKHMSGATDDMLNWMKGKLEAKGETLDYAALFGENWSPININFVKWIRKEAPFFDFSSKEKRISEAIHNQKDMIWAYETLGIKPKYMIWAFAMGDLELIESAGKMFEYVPTEDDIGFAAERGHLHIIKWFHKKYPKELSNIVGGLFLSAIRFGRLKIADYLVANFTIEKRVSPEIMDWVLGDKRLNLLKWIHEHPLIVEMPDANSEISNAAIYKDLYFLEWYDENIATVSPTPELREKALVHESTEVYIWLLGKYFKGDQQPGLDKDLQCALDKGNLKVVKMILEKDRSQDGKKFRIECDFRWKYPTMHWLKVNGRWCESDE